MAGGGNRVLAWVLAHCDHQGDDCLIWPFCKTSGMVFFDKNRKAKKARPFICERVHGPRPSPKHIAVATCRNKDCANPRHLAWQTMSEYRRYVAKVSPRPAHKSNGWRPSLEPEQIAVIRKLRGKVSHRDLSILTGMSESSIYKWQNKDATPRSAFSPRRDTKLRQLVKDGATVAVAAAALGIDERKVYARGRALGLKFAPQKRRDKRVRKPRPVAVKRAAPVMEYPYSRAPVLQMLNDVMVLVPRGRDFGDVCQAVCLALCEKRTTLDELRRIGVRQFIAQERRANYERSGQAVEYRDELGMGRVGI